jgi:hypothetical protein
VYKYHKTALVCVLFDYGDDDDDDNDNDNNKNNNNNNIYYIIYISNMPARHAWGS